MTMKNTALLALALFPLAAWANNSAEQLRCLAMSDSTARLACYDAAAIAIRDAKPVAAAPVAAAVAVSAVPTPATPDFGRKPTPAKQLDSHIPGKFEGWNPGGSVRLANGQVWRFVEGSRSFPALSDPKVTITPGFLGSFFIKIEGLGFETRVERVQ